jgi:polyketide synthase PksJ
MQLMESYYSLTKGQESLWIQWILDPKSTSNNISLLYRLEGKLNIARFQETITSVISGTTFFKIGFIKKNHHGFLYIKSKATINFHCLDAKKLALINDDDEINYLHHLINQPFDLLSEINHRVILLKSNRENTYYFSLSMPHILVDGYSANSLLKQVSNIYNTNNSKEINIERSHLLSHHHEFEVTKNDEHYWISKLKNQTLFSWGELLNKNISKAGTRCYVFLDRDQILSFKKICYSSKSTIFLGLMTVFSFLLYAYYDTPEITILYPVNLRNKEQKEILGYFVNLIPMLFTLSENSIFHDTLQAITQQRRLDRSHQNYPLRNIVTLLRKQALSPHIDFNIIFSRAKIFPDEFKVNNIKIDYVPFYPTEAIADLALLYDESEEGFIFTLEYKEAIFNNEFIQNMLDDFKALISIIASHHNQPLKGYSILSTDKQNQILRYGTHKICWQNSDLKPVGQQFAEVAFKYDQNIALVSGNKKMSYEELNQITNQVARYFLKFNSEKRIAVLLDRSVHAIITLLAIVKAGCAYVPLDSGNPIQRLQDIIDDSKTSILITDSIFDQMAKKLNIKEIIDINTLLDKTSQEDTHNIYPTFHLDDLIYIIYTSGSTGKPKGVPITHYNLARLFKVTDNYFNFKESDKWILFHSLAFDFSIWEIWGALLHGSELHIIPDSIRRSPVQTYQYIHNYQITVFNQTPFAFNQFQTIDHHQKKKLALRYIIFGGEKLPFSDLHLWFSNHPEDQPSLINMYGLTEATVHATYYRIRKEDVFFKKSIIGKPLDDMDAYVLNKHYQLIPPGVIGELYLSGGGLTKGYLNNLEINQAHFITSLFGDKNNKLYRTKDLVRWLPDGNLEYIGRNDKQVKLNGYRIELDEINMTLQTIPGISQAVTLLHPLNEHKQLVTFYRSEKNRHTDSSSIRDALKSLLPEYMMPSKFIPVKNMPLTSQGKLDVNHLLQLINVVDEAPIGGDTIVNLKEKILKIWQRVLANPHIKTSDNFFDIGGSSLALVEVHVQLEQIVDFKLPITDLFYYPTIDQLVDYMSSLQIYENNKKNTEEETFSNTPSTFLNEPIAIIGMAANLPGASNIQLFWENLIAGKEGISFFSDEELLDSGISLDEIQSPNYVKAKGIVEDTFKFDAHFFGISPREASILDPQHRLLLECAWTALEDAGYVSEDQAGKVGVFVSQSNIHSYLQTYLLNKSQAFTDTANSYQLYINNSADFLSTRLSYKFNLTGPSFTVQSGCSSSLLAISQACQSLREGQCDLAIAGGVALSMPIKAGYHYQEGMILSPDGHCRVFDEQANGTVPSNGVGIVVLKRLSQAIKDSDHIEAVIKGFAVNNDGLDKLSFTAPSQKGQREVIQNALKRSNCNPNDITYLETHGTGTNLGDPIEIAALNSLFNKGDRTEVCMIGSVKSSMGHLDTAAGVVGLIKTVLCLKHAHLVPNLYFKEANKKLRLEDTPFSVVADYRPWVTTRLPRRAGISAFAVGGTNVHMILEEPPVSALPDLANEESVIILSARTPDRLECICRNLAQFLAQEEKYTLRDISYTLQVGRKAFEHRMSFVSSDKQEVINYLKQGQITIESNSPHQGNNPSLAFLFPGQGSFSISLGLGLYNKLPIFTHMVDVCSEYLIEHYRLDVRSFFSNNVLTNTENTLLFIESTLSIFIMEYALAKQWMAWGINPSILLGHSLGEYVAACLAEVWSLEDTLDIIMMRTHLITKTQMGAMLTVSLDKETLYAYLDEELELAVVNSTRRCVVSGSTLAIHTLMKKLVHQGISCKLFNIPYAFHSSFMNSIADEFLENLKNYQFHPPKIPIISNLTGKQLTDQEAIDPNYWANHLKHTVNFHEGIKTLTKQHKIILEIGSGMALSAFVKQHNNKIKCYNLPNELNPAIIYPSVLKILSQLWMHGFPVRWKMLHNGKGKRVSLPTYPFKREYYHCKELMAPNIQKQAVTEWLYVPSWEYVEPVSEKKYTSLKLLIFKDNLGIADKVITFLEKQGHSIVTVSAHSAFQVVDNHYEIKEDSPEDYQRLANMLNNNHHLPDKILFFWPINNFSNNVSLISNLNCISQGLNQLIYLGRTVIPIMSRKNKAHLFVLTCGMWDILRRDKLILAQSLLLGPILTLPEEYPYLCCSSIDIDPLSVKKKSLWNKLANRIIDETQEESQKTMIAYRNNKRLVRTYSKASITNHYQFTHGKAYLITGGLGAIGITFAKYIASCASANIILLQRSTLPDRYLWDQLLNDKKIDINTRQKIEAIREIESKGSTVYIISADVTNQKEVKKAINNIRRQVGSISGVMHAAGIASGAIIQTISQESIHQALAPKILGALNLYAIFKNDPPEFTLFCSALSTITGYIGQVAYNSANAFLDAFAIWLTHKNYHALSVNWDRWQEVGMAKQIKLPSLYKELGGEKNSRDGIRNKEAMLLFPLLLTLSSPQIIISTVDLQQRLMQNQKSFDYLEKYPMKLSDQTIDLKQNLNRDQGEIYSLLEAVWQECLNIKTINCHDNFFDLGGDSLLAIQMSAILGDRYQLNILPHDLVESPTLDKLSNKLTLRTKELEGNESELAMRSPLLKFRSKEEGIKLFLLHPVGGTAFIYRELAEGIHPDISVYGLQSPSLDGVIEPLDRVEAIAFDYIQVVQSIQPEGPYYLAGASFGGTLAYEMAQQLSDQSQQVNFLAMFDTPGMEQMPDTLPNDADIIAYMLKVGAQKEIDIEQFYKLDLDEQIEYFLQHAGGLRRSLPSFNISHMKYYLKTYKANMKAMFNYVPQMYKGENSIHYFKAKERDAINPKHPELGWRSLLQNKLIFHEIPGNHITIMLEPYIQQLIEKINQLLS